MSHFHNSFSWTHFLPTCLTGGDFLMFQNKVVEVDGAKVKLQVSQSLTHPVFVH